MLHIVQAVNSKRVVETDDYITIKDVQPIVDNIVMNGGLYPADKIAESYSTLEGTVAPLGHPQANGQYISATSGDALQRSYIGAINRNVRYQNGAVQMDVVINKAQALAHPRGAELIERITNGGDPIHVSTGVLLERIEQAGNSNGKEYTWVASNMKFDHNAILLDQPGAGTPEDGVGMFLNSEQESVYIAINGEMSIEEKKEKLHQAVRSKYGIDERYVWITQTFSDSLIYEVDYRYYKVSYTFIDGEPQLVGDSVEVEREVEYKPKLADRIGNAILDLFAKAVPTSYNSNHAHTVPNSDESPETNEMTPEETKALIANELAPVLQANKELTDKVSEQAETIKSLTESIAANAKAEHDALVAEAAEKTGLEANALEGMTNDGLRALIGKTGSAMGVNAAMAHANADEDNFKMAE